MRIGFVAEDFILTNGKLRPSGCSYYRCLLPKNTLRGLPTEFGPPAYTAEHGFGVRTSKQEARFGFDVIVMKMLMSRWIPDQMRQAQELGQVIVVDVDDYYPGLHESNLAFEATDPNKNPITNREHYHNVIMAADWVTVSTPFLQEYYSQFRDNVVMIRNGINPEQFVKRKVRNTKPVLGWAGAIKWRSNDVETAREWLPDLLEEHDLLFHHAGDMEDAPKFADLAGVNPDRMILTPMRPLHQYHEMLDFDIGVVLLSDIPFNEAKSTIKGLEYAASNIPFVANDMPEYALLAQQGVGRVAADGDEFRAHIEQLLDYNTRKVEAATMRNLVAKDHSIQARAKEWAEFYAQFANHKSSIRNIKAEYRFLG